MFFIDTIYSLIQLAIALMALFFFLFLFFVLQRMVLKQANAAYCVFCWTSVFWTPSLLTDSAHCWICTIGHGNSKQCLYGRMQSPFACGFRHHNGLFVSFSNDVAPLRRAAFHIAQSFAFFMADRKILHSWLWTSVLSSFWSTETMFVEVYILQENFCCRNRKNAISEKMLRWKSYELL